MVKQHRVQLNTCLGLLFCHSSNNKMGFVTITSADSILKHDQQDATLYNTLYYCQRSTCFKRCFRSSSGAQICTCSIGYLSDLFAVTVETCRALTVIKSIIQRCVLLVILKNTLTTQGPMNVKICRLSSGEYFRCLSAQKFLMM
jgi:hypothetical protein